MLVLLHLYTASGSRKRSAAEVAADRGRRAQRANATLRGTASPLAGFSDTFIFGGGMRADEEEELARRYRAASSVFEWGMGSSTLIAAHSGVSRLSAVDSSEKWVEKCRGALASAARDAVEYKYRLVYVSVGAIGKWGIPTEDAAKPLWKGYSEAVDDESDAFDVYLVDGRFRVACACRAMLHGGAEALIVVHDFERPQYQALLKVATKLAQVDTLAVLRKRKSTTRDELEKMWQAYALLPTSGGHLDRKLHRAGPAFRAAPSGVARRAAAATAAAAAGGAAAAAAAAAAITTGGPLSASRRVHAAGTPAAAPLLWLRARGSAGAGTEAPPTALALLALLAGVARDALPAPLRSPGVLLAALGAALLAVALAARHAQRRVRCQACIACDAAPRLGGDDAVVATVKAHASPRARSPVRDTRPARRWMQTVAPEQDRSLSPVMPHSRFTPEIFNLNPKLLRADRVKMSANLGTA